MEGSGPEGELKPVLRWKKLTWPDAALSVLPSSHLLPIVRVLHLGCCSSRS